MKIDSNTYQEAHRLALMPRMKILFYGIVCGAVVPVMYLRSYYLPSMKNEESQNINALSRKVQLLEHRASSMEQPGSGTSSLNAENRRRSSENLGALAGVAEVPIASWHIPGRNRFSNDEQYRKLVQEANAIMLSSIM